jgi:hypothetical protein
MTSAVRQNHNPDCLSASRATMQQALGSHLDVRDPRSGMYWFIVCRCCRLTWYLPKGENKWTKDALTILRAHAQEHRP